MVGATVSQCIVSVIVRREVICGMGCNLLLVIYSTNGLDFIGILDRCLLQQMHQILGPLKPGFSFVCGDCLCIDFKFCFGDLGFVDMQSFVELQWCLLHSTDGILDAKTMIYRFRLAVYNRCLSSDMQLTVAHPCYILMAILQISCTLCMKQWL